MYMASRQLDFQSFVDRLTFAMQFVQDACFGASSPPTIMVISLYKHDGILQFNRLVLTGSIAVLNKVAIEQLQLAAARNRMVAKLWTVFEKAGVLMGRWLLR